LYKTEFDYIAADSTHHDPVSNVERLAAEDYEVGGEGRNHALKSECQASCNQAEGGGQPRRIGEPNRAKYDYYGYG
jgi:hypothetical protein